MAITELYSGTQTTVLSTEHVLNTTTPETTDGIFQVVLDISQMTLGDALEIRVKEKAISAGTQRTAWTQVITNAASADEGLWISPSVILMHGWDVTLKQTAGTVRGYPWSIRQVA